MARTELYRQAVTMHSTDLLKVLEGVRGSLVMPRVELLTILKHFPWNKAAMLPAVLEFRDGDMSVTLV